MRATVEQCVNEAGCELGSSPTSATDSLCGLRKVALFQPLFPICKMEIKITYLAELL